MTKKEELKIPVSREIYEKLETLTNMVDVSRQALIDLAFKDFFQSIRDDPEILIERFGLINDIKKVLDI